MDSGSSPGKRETIWVNRTNLVKSRQALSEDRTDIKVPTISIRKQEGKRYLKRKVDLSPESIRKFEESNKIFCIDDFLSFETSQGILLKDLDKFVTTEKSIMAGKNPPGLENNGDEMEVLDAEEAGPTEGNDDISLDVYLKDTGTLDVDLIAIRKNYAVQLQLLDKVEHLEKIINNGANLSAKIKEARARHYDRFLRGHPLKSFITVNGMPLRTAGDHGPTDLSKPRLMAILHQMLYELTINDTDYAFSSPLVVKLDWDLMPSSIKKIRPLLGSGFNLQYKYISKLFRTAGKAPFVFILGCLILDYCSYCNQMQKSGTQPVVFEHFLGTNYKSHHGNLSAGVRAMGFKAGSALTALTEADRKELSDISSKIQVVASKNLENRATCLLVEVAKTIRSLKT